MWTSWQAHDRLYPQRVALCIHSLTYKEDNV